MTDLVSVIIPVYKVEDYIHKCVDSVINQSYKNLEIILVDDGSPDNCPKICDEYAKKDKRIKVIHKKNGGLSDARNAGIDKCRGKYITFVDSDDYVEENYVELLLGTLKKYKTKIAVADCRIVYDNGRTLNISENKEYATTPEHFFELMLWGKRDLDNAAWAKIYDRSLFKNIRYPKGKLYEDTATTYKIIDLCNRVAINSTPVYSYMKRRDSITQCSFNEDKMQLIDSTKQMTDYVRGKYSKLNDACDRKVLWAYMSTLSQLAASGDGGKYKTIRRKLVKYVRENGKKIIKNENCSKRDKLGVICLLPGYWFYSVSWKAYLKINKKY